MNPQDNQDPSVQAAPVPTVQAFEVKLRSAWDVPLPLNRPLKDLSELNQVLAEHEEWATSLAAPGIPLAGRRACLRNQDLRGIDFARRDLRGADFSGSNLEGACFEGCRLMLANFQGAILRNADFRGAHLKKADFTGAFMDGAQLSHEK